MKKIKYSIFAILAAAAALFSSCKQDICYCGEDDTLPKSYNFKVNGVSFKLFQIEGGTFKMGAQSEDTDGDNYNEWAENNESPIHDVTLSNYFIGETEVTQGLWKAVLGEESLPAKLTEDDDSAPIYYVNYNTITTTFIKALNDSLHNSKQLPDTLSISLPTEAQWEYAARGGKKSKGYSYAGSDTYSDVSVCYRNTGIPYEIKTKKANELGLYDMSGNVWEWCEDYYTTYTSAAKTDPVIKSGSYKVLRGGSVYSEPADTRVSARIYQSPKVNETTYCDEYGFRLAISLVK